MEPPSQISQKRNLHDQPPEPAHQNLHLPPSSRNRKPPTNRPVQDVAYHLGKFYALGYNEGLWICNVDVNPAANAVIRIPTMTPSQLLCKNMDMDMVYGFCSFLVESSGELLVGVLRNPTHKRLEFYRMDESGEGKPRWIRIRDESMERSALFLGNVQSFSVSACDVPGCRENTVSHGRFVDDNKNYTLCAIAYHPKDGGTPIPLEYEESWGFGRHYYATWLIPSLS